MRGNAMNVVTERESWPFTGDLPPVAATPPRDLLPGQHNPFIDVYNMQYGRFLGSIGTDPSVSAPPAPSAEAGMAPGDYLDQVQRAMLDYPNELNSLSVEDDVSGNGIFDAPGTHGNINPDDGIFADRESLPGYVARERPFQPSEVLDINTGRPVVYVPGNSFMMDPRTPWQMSQARLYEPGMPNTGGNPVQQVSTVDPLGPAWPVYGPVGQTEPEPSSNKNVYIMMGLAGLSIGLLVGLLK